MSKPSKPWAIALVVSVVLNVFLGGIVVGSRLSRPSGPPALRGHLSLKGLRGRLDPQARKALSTVEAKYGQQIHSRMKAARQSRQSAMEAMAADPFDERVARERLADFRDKLVSEKKVVHEALVELAGSLPPEQRVKFRQALRPGPRHFGHPSRRPYGEPAQSGARRHRHPRTSTGADTDAVAEPIPPERTPAGETPTAEPGSGNSDVPKSPGPAAVEPGAVEPGAVEPTATAH